MCDLGWKRALLTVPSTYNLYTRKRLIQVYRDDILASDHPSDGSSVIKTTLLNMFTCTPMLGAKFYES